MIYNKSVATIKIKISKLLVLITCLLLFSVNLSLAVNPSQVPLFLTSSVDPNIMFVIDDSGSMLWEVLPDDVLYNFVVSNNEWWDRMVAYVYPQRNTTTPIAGVTFQDCIYTSGTSTGCDYWRSSTYMDGSLHIVPRFDADNRWAAYFRSQNNNPIYYNPEIRYRPWVHESGVEWANADPTAAYHNPAFTAKGTRNLTIDNTQRACWLRDDATSVSTTANLCTTANRTFWPATYFQYNGGIVTDSTSYTRVEIRTGNTYSRGVGRSDCADPTACTYQEEIQNFANWYTYHRSRISAARAGIGRAFSEQGAKLRVGYSAINKASSSIDNVSTDTVVSGVRPFLDDSSITCNFGTLTAGCDRTNFFTNLYRRDVTLSGSLGTPLRRALDSVGQYYSREDQQGPWSTTPGATGGIDYTCRPSYTILMTDGYWNASEAGTSACRNNVDGTSGPTITGPGAQSYTYTNVSPFNDGWSNTLADVAMCYWKNDLHTNLENRVPTSDINPAFWQHMVTFGVSLGVFGTQNPADVFDAIDDSSVTINWTQPSATGTTENIDDLLHAAVNSRGGFFSASDPDTFATELSNTLRSIMARTESSAAAIATNSTRLVDGSIIYQARFDSTDWSGELRAYQIADDGSVITNQADWIAYPHPGLTPPYLGWSTADSGKIPAHGSRSIYTWTGSVGTPFTVAQWAILDSAQRLALQDGGTEAEGQSRLNWIRGDSSNEDNATGLRERTSVLGDIVNSNPLIVGVPNLRYERLPTGTAGRDSYLTFRQSVSSRPRMLYVGANDGMLHAFDAATGEEKFAYVPAGVYSNLAKLTKPDYPDNHIYLVDGSAATGDAYIEYKHHSTGAMQPADWRTILVGTLGAGGKSVFALDVTNPNTFSHHNILWELTDPDLGYAIGQQPAVARLQNGQWAAIFSNGYDSTNHRAVLFIVNLETGVVQKIDTLVGDATNKNGLSSPSLLLDSQRTLKAVYAGDLQGNLWKFDLSDPIATNWNVAYSGAPLFKARNSAGQVQPITAPLVLGEPQSPGTGVMVYFGTGKYFEVGDNIVTSPQTQSFYGIFDNGSEITEVNRSTLVGQSITSETTVLGNDYRETSNNTVDYSSDRGWYIDFLVPPQPGTGIGERVVSAPLLRFGRVVFTTLIPSDDPCSAGGTGWLMLMDALSGARPSTSAFGIETAGDPYYSGIRSRVGIIGTPAIIRDGTMDLVYMGGSDLSEETEGVQQEDIMTGAQGDFGRRSWRQLQ